MTALERHDKEIKDVARLMAKAAEEERWIRVYSLEKQFRRLIRDRKEYTLEWGQRGTPKNAQNSPVVAQK